MLSVVRLWLGPVSRQHELRFGRPSGVGYVPRLSALRKMADDGLDPDPTPPVAMRLSSQRDRPLPSG